MALDPATKMTRNNDRKIEKYILRKAFDIQSKYDNQPYLP